MEDASVIAGKALARLRRIAGVSLKDMAQVLRVSYQQVQKYENGTNAIPLARIPDLCDFFGVSSDAFLTRESKTPDDDLIAIHAAYAMTNTPELRTKIRKIVEILAA